MYKQRVNAETLPFYLHRWVDLSPVTYTHWGPGEPNNANGEEQCVQMNRHQGTDFIYSRSVYLLVRVYHTPPLVTPTLNSLFIYFFSLKVDGTMPTVVGLEQVTSVKSSPEMSTPLPHPHSPGRETAPKVTYTFYI